MSGKRHDESRRVDNILHRVYVAVVGDKRALRDFLGSDLLDTTDEMLRIMSQNDGFGLNEVEQRQ